MKNISVVTTLGILPFDKNNLPIAATGNTIDFDDIPGIEDLQLFKFTFESAMFQEQKKSSVNGPLYAKSINLRCPGFNETLETHLAPFLDKPVMIFVVDPNGISQLVFPLTLDYDKNNPGTASGYRGYFIKMEGNYHKPSIFVKNVSDLSEISILGQA